MSTGCALVLRTDYRYFSWPEEIPLAGATIKTQAAGPHHVHGGGVLKGYGLGQNRGAHHVTYSGRR